MRIEDLPPIKLPSSELPPVRYSFIYLRAIIEFLVENSTQPESELFEKGGSLWGEDEHLIEVFRNLVQKFKKLRKTK